MKKHLTVILLALSIAATAQTRQQKAEAVVSTNEALKGAAVAVMAITSDGDTLVDINSSSRLVPASNMKLFTTGAALDRLGADYRFRTRLAAGGPVSDGVLHGDLIIIGGGDPTLAYPGPTGRAAEDVFAEWKALLDSAGIKAVEGLVVGDGSWFDGMKESPDWEWADLGTYYGTGASGLQFCGNTLNFSVAPGVQPGDSLQICQSYPETPWMSIEYDCRTGEKNTGDRLYLYTTELSQRAVLRGTFAFGKQPKTVSCSNKFPELTCAYHFSQYLETAGVPVGGYAAGPAGEEVTILGETLSPRLFDIVRRTNFESDNLYAETLFRTLGKEQRGSADYETSARALGDALRRLGTPAGKDMQIKDGSGLSAHNLVSPAYMCRFLAAMMDSRAWKSYKASLPRAGREGTVAPRLAKLPLETRERVRMKSGSHTGVRAFSGYYFLPDGRTVIFSVIINNSLASSAALSSAADEIISAIL